MFFVFIYLYCFKIGICCLLGLENGLAQTGCHLVREYHAPAPLRLLDRLQYWSNGSKPGPDSKTSLRSRICLKSSFLIMLTTKRAGRPLEGIGSPFWWIVPSSCNKIKFSLVNPKSDPRIQHDTILDTSCSRYRKRAVKEGPHQILNRFLSHLLKLLLWKDWFRNQNVER